MKKKALSLLAFIPAFMTVTAQQPAVPDVCALVNPIIGTNGTAVLIALCRL